MKKRYTIIFIFVLTVLIKYYFQYHPEICQTYFCNFLYPHTAKLQQLIFGLIDFSAGDILYILLIFSALHLIFNLKYTLKKRLTTLFLSCLAFLSAFYLLWGMNYYKPPLQNKLNVPKTFSLEDLTNATNFFLEQSCKFRKLMEKDLPENHTITINQLNQWSETAFKTLYQKNITGFKYQKSIKESLFSGILSYMGYSGYLNPFTGEAQINCKIPDYQKPITAFHEVAHQMGFAFESEANFIGFLACESSDNPFVRYSGSVFALRHCLYEVRKHNPELYKTLLKKIDKAILDDFQKTSHFWESHQNPFAPVLEKTYDTYLKAHQQSAGVQSYHQVAQFLIMYYLNQT